MKTGLICIISWVALLSTQLYSADVDGLIAQGDEYYEDFNNLEAYRCYKKAYVSRPDDAELLAKLTWSCNNIGEDLASKESEAYFQEAVRYAAKLEKLAPDRAKTYFLMAITSGNLALHRGGRDKVRLSRHVERDAKRAIAIDPDYSPAYAALGIYYREVAQLNWALRMVAQHLLGGLPQGTLEDSEKMLLTAIEKDHGNVYAHFQLGLTYEAMGKERDAAKQFRQVISLPVVDHQDPLFKQQARDHLRGLI